MVTGQQLITAAKQYLGVPYRFGGKTKTALDCSGLITLAAADLGVTVVHGSANQIAACKQITVQEAWDTPGAMLYRPGHNALSLGDGRAVEALTTGVTITQRTDTYQGQPRFTMGGQIPGITYTKEKPVTNRPRMVSPAQGRVSSEYGRRAPIPGVTTGTFHAGIDIANKTGTPIYAAFAGTVESTGTNGVPGRSGRYILIRNPDGNRQYYGHLNRSRVKTGQKVAQGQHIGDMGATGNVTGPHLHFEIWANGSHTSHRNPRIDFNHFGVTPGSKPVVVSPSKPKPAPPAKGNAAVLKRQKDLNEYAKAGLVEDGIRGPVMKAWDKWVGDAQRALNAFKSSKKKLIVDEHYGPVMAAYVGDVQKRNRLVVDRVLGPVMIAWMRSHGSKIPNRPSNRP